MMSLSVSLFSRQLNGDTSGGFVSDANKQTKTYNYNTDASNVHCVITLTEGNVKLFECSNSRTSNTHHTKHKNDFIDKRTSVHTFRANYATDAVARYAVRCQTQICTCIQSFNIFLQFTQTAWHSSVTWLNS